MMTAPEELSGVPPWARAKVAQAINDLRRAGLQTRQAGIVSRLALDPRMRKVWKELTERHRGSGEFVFPAQPLYGYMPIGSPEDIQGDALARVISLTFRVVVHPSYSSVLKPSDVAKARKRLLSEATMLRRLAGTATGSPEDAAALWRVAELQERGATDLPTQARPRVVNKDRGDRMERGVQIAIARMLMQQFGARLDNTAATLTVVALGIRRRSNRVARSALSPAKQPR